MAGIEDIHPKLACKHADVQIIRDVVAGARTIKRKRTEYLPFSRTGQPIEEYERLLQYTSFFPGTSRTAYAKRGLMTAKNVVLNAPVLQPIENVITPQGDNVRDMAEEVIWETFQSNFTGLLTDHPEAPEGASLNAANALRLNYRPFIHLFPFESILWIDYAVKGPTRTFNRVVLREREDRILELVMVNGIYVQRVWEKREGRGFEITEVREPRKDGQRLTSIPFVIVSDNSKPWPQDSILKDLAELNLDHYKVSARIANIQMFASGVVPVFAGVKVPKDDDGNDIPPTLHMGPGGVVLLEEPTAKWGFLEPEGHTMESLMKTRDDYQEQMAKTGGNLIASERNKAPESDTSAARRAAGEDSAVASLALVYARRISDALSWCSWWMDGSKAVFTLNTDYKMAGMTAQERTAALAELQSGNLAWETWFLERRDKGVVNSSLSPEEERARIDQDNIDRPTTEL